MAMFHWMESHFHDWIYYKGVAFSVKLLEQTTTQTRTPFVITYNPARPISTTVRKNINILQSSSRCRQIFPPPPMLLKGVPTFVAYLLEALHVIVTYNSKNHPSAFQNAIIHAALPVRFYSKA